MHESDEDGKVVVCGNVRVGAGGGAECQALGVVGGGAPGVAAARGAGLRVSVKSRVASDKRRMLMRKADEMDGKEQMDGETREQPVWTVRSLSSGEEACDGVRWWARRFSKKLASLGFGGVVAFPEGVGANAAERRLRTIREASARVAESGAFGRAECHVWKQLGLEASYRGVGGRAPLVEVDGVRKERMADFAKALCAASGEERAVVWEGVEGLQSVEGGEWTGDAGNVWWLERKGKDEAPKRRVEDEDGEREARRRARELTSEQCERTLRGMGWGVVARVRVEDWFAPEGVFRWARFKEQRGWKGQCLELALRWARKGGEKADEVAERVLVVGGEPLEVVEDLVASVPGAVCRYFQIAEELKLDDSWLEEMFGVRPQGGYDGEWELVEAGEVQQPRPTVFGWHETYYSVRERRRDLTEEELEMEKRCGRRLGAMSLEAEGKKKDQAATAKAEKKEAARLWAMTRKGFLSQPGGKGWVRLAQMISFYSFKKVARHVLRHLWGELADPSRNTEQDFEQALSLLQEHGLLEGADERHAWFTTMRRVIAEATRKEWPDAEDQIGTSLARCPGMSGEDWVGFYRSMGILRHIPDVLLDGETAVEILKRNPEFGEICPWERLDGENWANLLWRNPQFAEKCDWSKLDGENWEWLLKSIVADFSPYCDWEKLTGDLWERLLYECPEFAKHCDWGKLHGTDLAVLLCERPQLGKKCDWSKLSSGDWVWLLSEQPEFARKCPWEELSGVDWANLLCSQPQFAKKCDWNKLPGLAWAHLLAAEPRFADKCPWEMLAGEDWAKLLGKQPQFAERCSWDKLSGSDWAGLLGEQPRFANKCSWKKLRARAARFDWARLLSVRPQFANECPWEELSGSDWGTLLCAQPQFADKCDWSKLDGEVWVSLLEKYPRFVDRIVWERMDGSSFARLLNACPEFADKYDLTLLSGHDWAALLGRHPRLADRCDWKKLDGGDWALLVGKQPQFSERCEWEMLSGGDWSALLASQAYFVERCPWEKMDGHAWASLLREQPQFAEKCDWEKLDGGDWATLLESQPQYAPRCPWETLNGDQWTRLLLNAPQFAEKCDWGKLGGRNWTELVLECPQFADRCDWDKLAHGDWTKLLYLAPHYADKCDWSKLGKEDWEHILRRNPQFADRQLGGGGSDTQAANNGSEGRHRRERKK